MTSKTLISITLKIVLANINDHLEKKIKKAGDLCVNNRNKTIRMI